MGRLHQFQANFLSRYPQPSISFDLAKILLWTFLAGSGFLFVHSLMSALFVQGEGLPVLALSIAGLIVALILLHRGYLDESAALIYIGGHLLIGIFLLVKGPATLDPYAAARQNFVAIQSVLFPILLSIFSEKRRYVWTSFVVSCGLLFWQAQNFGYDWVSTLLLYMGTGMYLILAVIIVIMIRRALKKLYQTSLTDKAAALRKQEEVEALKKYFSILAHDIKNPMSATLAAADMLSFEELSSNQKNWVDMIALSSRRVEKMLDLYWKERCGHNLQGKETTFCLMSFLEETAQVYLPLALKKQLQFRKIFSAKLPQSITADYEILSHLLLNLICNAVKYTESGEVVFRVDPYCREEEEGLRFIIEDTGAGMPSEIQEHWENLESCTVVEGWGLGLTIVSEMAKLLDCRIELETQLEQGTRFTVYLAQRESRP